MRLRSHLVTLVLAVLVPMIAFATILVVVIGRQQRASVQQGALETVRALISAIDERLISSVATLEAVAALPSLDGDLRRFQADASRVLQSRGDWLTISLLAPDGRQLVDLLRPFGAPLPRVVEPRSLAAVVATRRPVIGDLVVGQVGGKHTYAIRVPVIRQGAVLHVLTAVVNPASLVEVLNRQRLPEDWVATVFDRDKRIVARTKSLEQFLGRPVSAEFVTLLDAGGAEGWAVTRTLEGLPVYTAFARSSISGWGIGLGIPASAVAAPLERSLLTMVAGGVGFLLLTLLFAAVVGRRITAPILALVSGARAFGERGDLPATSRAGVTEIDDLRRAFSEAAGLREQAERRGAFLSEASGILASSLDYDVTLARVARLAIPELADLCAIDLLEDDGTTRRVAAAHVDPHKEAMVRDVRARHGFNPDAPSGVPAVIRTRQTAFVADATEADLALAARSPEQLAMFQALGLKSWMIVPLIARGQILGALTFVVTESGRRYAPADVAFAESVANRAAVAIDNARLYREADAARRRAEAASIEARRAQREAEVFGAVTASITASLDLQTVLEQVVNGARELCDADIGRIALRDGETGQMRFRYWAGSRLGDHHPTLVDRERGLGGLVWRTGRPHRVADHRQDEHRHPGYAGLIAEEGTVATLVVPIRLRDEVEGLIYLDRRQDRAFTDRDQDLVQRFADHAAVAIQNARSLAAEQAARGEAEGANRAKDEFLAVLSHELRTPLNAVYGWARMLRAGQVHEDARERALEAIVRNANAQVQLIDDLLDISRIVTGKLRLDVRPVDLRGVVEAAVDAVRPASEAKALRLQSVLDPRAGPITGDPDRLQQVVWNLLMNAVKFTPRGGRIQVRLERVDSHVEIVVSDTGQGIGPDVLPFIFDRFRQADSSSTRAHGGLGLGLALVRHLVELHGGSVAAQSPGEGQGATFIVKLPLTIADLGAGPAERQHPTAASLDRPGAAVRLDGLRLLVVDDDRDAVELAATILTGAGAVVRTCASAAEALEVFQAWRPDVLLSDIEMPGENGYALIRKIRGLGRERGGDTPAVALTAYGRMQDRILSLTAGYSMHVPKPVDPGELTTIIASVAGRAR